MNIKRKIGKNRDKARIWIEGSALADAGWIKGKPYSVVSDIIDEANANDALPAPSVYPEVNLKAHPEYSAERVASGLMLMGSDPRANPREKFLAAAVAHALRK